jgi:hypothetical protein
LAEAGFNAFTLDEIMQAVMVDFTSREAFIETMLEAEDASLHEYYHQ